MDIFKGMAENNFERMLKIFSSIANWSEVAKHLEVTIEIKNLATTSHPVWNLADLAKRSWIDLMDGKKRYKIVDEDQCMPDLLISIFEVDGMLEVKVESSYLMPQEQSQISEIFEDFAETANNILDEIFGRDRKALIISGSLSTANTTRQIMALGEFFEDKLEKVFFAVLTKKFITNCKKS